MKTYVLTEAVRKAFRENNGAQNSDQLEAALQALLIHQPEKKKVEVVDIEPVMPKIDESSETITLRQMYPSLAGKKRG